MISGRRVLVVVPARGGSKGVRLKNLRTVGGVPLVARVGEIVRAMPEIDRGVVSTDHDEIALVAEAAGLSAPFRRPLELSGDRIGDYEVLAHALKEMEQLDACRYDIVVMLQPTSPFRRPEHVLGCVRMLIDGGWDSVWSLSETDSKAHPLKQLTVADGLMEYYDPAGREIIARQQLQPVYHRNGLAYAFTRECLLDHQTIKGPATGAYIVNEHLVNIDTEFDLDLANFLALRSSNAND